jgi:hypothetical protein
VKAAKPYIPVRVVDMRGIDLNVFRFNYDLTLALLLMNADGTIYTTYAGRDWSSASSHQSTESLARVLRETVAVHDAYKKSPRPPKRQRPRVVENLPWWKRDKKPQKCFHCHMIHDAMQREGRAQRRWTERDQYTWPDPVQAGLRFDRDGQVVVSEVTAGSPAARAGLKPGDRITAMGKAKTLSFGDIQRALNDTGWGPARIEAVWRRGGAEKRGTLVLPKGWKKPEPEQYAWRPMKWSMPPMPGFGGPPLTAEQKQALGIPAGQFAFRVQYVVTWGPNAATGKNAAKAGIRRGTIVTSVDGKSDFLGMNHFHAWFRMTRRPGKPVRVEVIQNGTRRTLELTPLP